jgi:hypothetical protein
MNEDFYSKLATYTAFEKSADATCYARLPENWSVVITDVKGSTNAIEAGRYKEVNAVAVASVVAIMNRCKPLEIPFVFGGDGVTACVPNSVLHTIRPALAASKVMAREQFALELRIGIVGMEEIRKRGQEVLVAKFQCNSNYIQAMFMGKGLNLAESLVKDSTLGSFLVTDNHCSDPTLFDGFECRWNSIPSPSEENVSLLVEACVGEQEREFEILSEIIAHIDACYEDPAEYHPVREALMSLTGNSRLLGVESRIRTAYDEQTDWKGYLFKLRLIRFIGKFLMAFKVRTKETDWGSYKHHFVQNSDFRKLDGTLRMIIAGTKAQREALMTILESYREKGLIHYGYFTASSALVTCIVTRYEQEHLHLLDGTDGGYAMAAKMLKAQKLSH